MKPVGWRGWEGLVLLAAVCVAWLGTCGPSSRAQEMLPSPTSLQISAGASPGPVTPAALAPEDKPLPISLPTALQLAGVRPLDIAAAAQQLEVATSQLRQAQVLWLPTLDLGTDYARHDGRVQSTAGDISSNSHSSFMIGAGPYAVFSLSDALFGPLAARQQLRAREASLQTARNDTLLAVAQAYFNVQQARGNLGAAEEVNRYIEQAGRTAQEMATAGLLAPLEVVRIRAALSASRLTLQTAREQWRVASAELVRLLRLDPSAVVEPVEPPHLRVTLVGLDQPLEELLRVGLTTRPELANQQALVQATLERLRQERVRPLIPSVLLRGFSTPVTGTLAGGVFGGGINNDVSNFGGRLDLDLQVLWQLQNLGLGNLALVRQRRAENQAALLELIRTQDQVTADIAKALAQARSAAARVAEADAEVRDALDSAKKNLEGQNQTKGVRGEGTSKVLVLVVRPLEVIAAVQALGQAYADYYGAVADYDRTQFLLYHALGHPAQAVAGLGADCPAPSPVGDNPNILPHALARPTFGPPIPCD